MNKKILCGLLATALSANVCAQSVTSSPYSQYGLGVLSERSQGFSRAMNGVGQGLRMGTIVNTLNPASYSAIDSLTMIFDMGVTLQLTNFKEGNTRVNARNANFDYAVGSFRLFPGVGMAFGVLPYTNVGYNYSTTTYKDADNGTITETHKGEGGLHEVFLGAGWQVLRPLSIGVNVGYLWGTIDRTVASSATSSINAVKRAYSTTVSSYRLEGGLQWQQMLSKTDRLTLGATVGIGHKLGADAECLDINVSNSDTTRLEVADAYQLPMTYSVGASWSHAGKLLVGADVSLQQWGSLDYPAISERTAGGKRYALQDGLLKDRYKVSAGLDYVPNIADRRNFLKRVHYRLGAGYATPYYYINGKEGPRELSVSAGFGIPLQRVAWNARGSMRPMLNLSAQWVNTSAKDMITENSFRINVGITFNERWFAKWKVD